MELTKLESKVLSSVYDRCLEKYFIDTSSLSAKTPFYLIPIMIGDILSDPKLANYNHTLIGAALSRLTKKGALDSETKNQVKEFYLTFKGWDEGKKSRPYFYDLKYEHRLYIQGEEQNNPTNDEIFNPALKDELDKIQDLNTEKKITSTQDLDKEMIDVVYEQVNYLRSIVEDARSFSLATLLIAITTLFFIVGFIFNN